MRGSYRRRWPDLRREAGEFTPLWRSLHLLTVTRMRNKNGWPIASKQAIGTVFLSGSSEFQLLFAYRDRPALANRNRAISIPSVKSLKSWSKCGQGSMARSALSDLRDLTDGVEMARLRFARSGRSRYAKSNWNSDESERKTVSIACFDAVGHPFLFRIRVTVGKWRLLHNGVNTPVSRRRSGHLRR